MRTIVLIACVKIKLPHRAPASELYTSTLFRLSLAYARSLHPDAIYVLSAQYGLLELEQEIEPYEQTLSGAGESEKRAWAARVLRYLAQKTNLNDDCFVYLAGTNYRKYITPHTRHFVVPLEGKAFGEQLQALKRWLE